MQRSLISRRDKAVAWAAVLAVHASVVVVIIRAGGTGEPGLVDRQEPIEIFDVVPPPPPPLEEEVQEERSPEAEGAASPPNILSQATPVEAPEPVVPLPREAEIAASPTPREGSDPTQGAAPTPGPGTGAGGVGTGTGSGGAGDGTGGGGAGATRPRLVSGQFRTRHYPRELQDDWVTAGPVLVTFQVQLNGRVTGCRIYQSSGNPAIDRETCRLAEARLRFRPATDSEGRPYVETYGYQQARTR